MAGLTAEQVKVDDDESAFYGKRYWLDHQTHELGLPDIHARARGDVAERNLHWLATLLSYRLPPARSLELGCAHGSFVALMRYCGFDAEGIEMSPWVVEFARNTFGVPVLVGPVEDLDVEPDSVDVIVLMDVLEHLPDPMATMAHCRKLLKADGIFLVQTPQFEEGRDCAALVEGKDAFLEMMQSDEHLYLFSKRSVSRLFEQIGAGHIEFERAMFQRYDMFFLASPEPLTKLPEKAIEQFLLKTPEGRLVLALLDLRRREREWLDRLSEYESILASRDGDIGTLSRLLTESETDRAARGEQIETLGELLRESEEDRAARGEQIETLSRLLQESEINHAAGREQIEALSTLVSRREADRAFARNAISGLLAHGSLHIAGRIAGWKEVSQLRDWLQHDDE